MTQPVKHVVVLISGNGSNLQALIDAQYTPALPNTKIVLVVSNRASAFGLTRASQADIPTLCMSLKAHKDAGKTRSEYDVDLATAILTKFQQIVGVPDAVPDLVVLAGFMHIVSPDFLMRFPPGGLVNLHPALPGEFDGAHAIDRAFAAFGEGKITRTGVMVHRVIAEVDRGEVLLTEEIPILAGDTLSTLEDRIHAIEHGIIVRGVKLALGV
ncbi:phosphoribosylglycinamide formyltransferase [Chytriomyces cf. hyalinus JEL632]|nr:phosphoribosylglycinamide formyltransferase [Chytriomyces cf. hyalinus JEL632]